MGQGHYLCCICATQFDSDFSIQEHLEKDHNDLKCAGNDVSPDINKYQVFNFTPANYSDWLGSFQHSIHILSHILRDRLPCEWYLTVRVKFYKLGESETSTNEKLFNSSLQMSHVSAYVEQQLGKSGDEILELIKNFENWAFDSVLGYDLKVGRRSLKGTFYIPTPQKIKNSFSILNIESNDHQSFMWSILASLHPVKDNATRVYSYLKYQKELNFQRIPFPVKIGDIDRFEKLNRISVNVFQYKNEIILPYLISKLATSRHHVDLLLLQSGERSHYCLIKDFNKLMFCFTKEKKYYCRFCLYNFPTESELKSHIELCSRQEVQRVSLPKKGSKLKFDQFRYQLKAPFVVYYDFEFLVNPCGSSGHDPEPIAFAYIVIDHNGQFYQSSGHRGRDAADAFLEEMHELETKLDESLKAVKPLAMTPQDELNFRNATRCGICHKPLGDDRVRGHSHREGHFRFAAHSACNLNYKVSYHIPVIAHNAKGYDLNFIVQKLGKMKNVKIRCIGNDLHSYTMLTMGRLRFVDSKQFLDWQFDYLAQQLTSFPILGQVLPDDERSRLLTRKGVMCSEYLTDEQKLEEEQLPLDLKLYSSGTKRKISVSDYEHAQTIWKEFNIKNLGEYLKLHLISNVILLAQVFENFRQIALNNFDLDPLHMISALKFTWQAFLKFTHVEIENISNSNVQLFLESGLRDNVAMVGSKRIAIANDPRIPDFDGTNLPSSIIYLEKTDLFGAAMCDNHPTGDYRFLSQGEIDKFDIKSVDKDSPKGYILEVDLDYPEHLHDAHNDYPMAAEYLNITHDLWSPYAKTIAEKHKITQGKRNIRLTPNLRSKSNYVCHYRNLQFYVKFGLVIKRIHRILEFSQSAFIRPFVTLNLSKTNAAMTAAERDFWQRQNVSLCERLLERRESQQEIYLVTSQERAQKIINSPACLGFKIFDNDLVAIHSVKQDVLLENPVGINFTLLELTKLYMLEFHYGYMREKFGHRATLVLADVNSFVYHVRSPDLFREIQPDVPLQFDTSNFDRNHFLYSEVNKGVMNKMKIGFPMRPIKEMVALSARNYSILFGAPCQKIGFQDVGLQRSTLRAFAPHDNFRQALFDLPGLNSRFSHTLTDNSQTSLHTPSSPTSPFDDTKFLLSDGIHALSYFHYRNQRFA